MSSALTGFVVSASKVLERPIELLSSAFALPIVREALAESIAACTVVSFTLSISAMVAIGLTLFFIASAAALAAESCPLAAAEILGSASKASISAIFASNASIAASLAGSAVSLYLV